MWKRLIRLQGCLLLLAMLGPGCVRAGFGSVDDGPVAAPEAGVGEGAPADTALEGDTTSSDWPALDSLPGYPPSNGVSFGAAIPAGCELVPVLASTTLDTDVCELDACSGTIRPATGGNVAACVLRAGVLTVDSSVAVHVVGTRGLILVLDAAAIEGTVDASASGPVPGPGGGAGGQVGVSSCLPGSGPGAGECCATDDGGGGGAGFAAPGGAGGRGDQGDSAPAGAAYGSPTLVPLLGGSGGATGRQDNIGETTTGGGGGGGGAIQISAAQIITVEGVIRAAGGGGQGSNSGPGGGGGGSGGAILLEAPLINIDGRLSVAGGGGGGFTAGQDGAAAGLAPGGPGSNASGAGGKGGGGDGSGPHLQGSAGTAGSDCGGGGGGAAGRVRINTVLATPLPSDIINGAVTVGPL